MIWTLLALLSMVILGGFISYYGDLQGRRWGKKRVSWFGLRPKHTAILITSLTGAFIALFSAVTLLLISPTVREVVLRGERLIRENKELNTKYEAKLRDSDTQLAASQAKRSSAEADVVRYTQELTTTRSELARDKQELARAKEELETRSKKIHAAQAEIFQTDRSLKEEQGRVVALKTIKASLLQAKAILTAQRVTLQKQIKNFEDTNDSIGKENVSLTRQKAELEKNNRAMLANNAALLTTNTALKKESDQLTRNNTALQEANKRLLAANDETEQQKSDLEQRIQQLTQRQAQLLSLLNNADTTVSQYAALRQRPILLRAGELLTRQTFDAHQRPEAVRKQLLALLDDAGATALLRGAGKGENGRAALLYNPQAIALAGSQANDERAPLEALVQKLSGQNTRILVTANTLTNTLQGEQALIDLDYQPVTPTYRKGETVAQSAPIDARKPVGKVIEAIVQFLQRDVRDAALKKGIVPQIDLQTGAKQVGVFGPVELLELTEKVKRMGGQVQIRAVASESLNSADTLQLAFKLSRPESDSN